MVDVVDPVQFMKDSAVQMGSKSHIVFKPQNYSGPVEFLSKGLSVSHGERRGVEFLDDTLYTRWCNAVAERKRETHPYSVSAHRYEPSPYSHVKEIPPTDQ